MNEDILDTFYNNYYNIHFIFNYSTIISTYLKCLFYKVHIKNETLNNFEQKIYNYYSNLIHSKEPLIFKFIDFYKDDLNIYSYDNIGLIYYEFDTINNEWITYNVKYKSFDMTIDSVNTKLDLYRIFPMLIGTRYSPFLTNKKFIMDQLKIDEFDYNRIYNSFNYNNYYNHNNTYFKYSGNPNNPFSDTISETKKLSNIMGIIIINSSNSNVNLTDLSRNIFTLGTIYSLHNDNRNYYFKTGANTGYTNINIAKSGDKLGVLKIKHVLYCILDQVEELNYKLLLEIILNKNIDDLWNNEEDLVKYKIKDLFNTIDFNKPELSNDIYNTLNTYLTTLSEPLDLLEIINNNLDKFSYKIYRHCNSIYNIIDNIVNDRLNLQGKKIQVLKEPKIITLMTYLLYDLDNYYKNENYRSFYNKRWLFSLLESSLLNAKLLNIDLMTTAQIIKSKSLRIAESASFTKNTFILSKALSKKEVGEYLDLDK